MDWRVFIVELVKPLAWPAALVVGLLLLRRPITDLMGLLSQLKYGKLEMRFSDKVHLLEQKADAALPASSSATAGQFVSGEMARLAEHSPRAAVIEAWIRVKEAAVSALKQAGIKLSREKHVAPQELEIALRENRLLTDDQLLVFRQLRNLRNAAVHGTAFSLDGGAALQYAITAQRVVSLLERDKGAPST